jgi:hypothetical protein
MNFPASNSVVLKQVLDRAQIATVGGLLGVTVAAYLEVAGDAADPAEPDVFASLSSTHRAAIQAERNFVWCLERFGGEAALMETASVAHDAARWLDEAFGALAAARGQPPRWRTALRLAPRVDAGLRAERARGYAHAAMAYSEQVERLRELLVAI